MSDNKKTFEENLKRLEEIVRALESSDSELDKSLALFEEGTALVRLCTKELDEAETKISVLTKEHSNE
ncbi:MAG: exodeoxyribonuclease VII small subunit [Clostridia bacterium]|nr:exodeoxyribonuclease VII small subunit [Clostridia bacterium]